MKMSKSATVSVVSSVRGISAGAKQGGKPGCQSNVKRRRFREILLVARHWGRTGCGLLSSGGALGALPHGPPFAPRARAVKIPRKSPNGENHYGETDSEAPQR